VIGGGPAGLTAAIYLARYCRTVLLADSGQSRAALISESHNYPGFMGLSGPELLKRLRSQAQEYGAYIQHSEIRSLNFDTAAFVAWSEVGAIRARTVILASGLVDEAPPVEGMSDAVGSGKIRYCPICDGYEAIDKRIGVVGPFEGAGRKALFLRTYSRDVWLFATDTPQTRSDLEQRLGKAGVRVAGKPVRVRRDSCSISIALEGGTHETLDVLYSGMGCYVRSRLATALGASCNELGI
jgi:thioredoxin reductase (NADPH)